MRRNKEGQVSKFLKNFGTAVNHTIVEILGDLNVFSLHVHGIYIVYFDFLKKVMNKHIYSIGYFKIGTSLKLLMHEKQTFLSCIRTLFEIKIPVESYSTIDEKRNFFLACSILIKVVIYAARKFEQIKVELEENRNIFNTNIARLNREIYTEVDIFPSS